MAKTKNKGTQTQAPTHKGRFVALVGLGMAAYNLYQAVKDFKKK